MTTPKISTIFVRANPMSSAFGPDLLRAAKFEKAERFAPIRTAEIKPLANYPDCFEIRAACSSELIREFVFGNNMVRGYVRSVGGSDAENLAVADTVGELARMFGWQDCERSSGHPADLAMKRVSVLTA